MRLFFLFLFLLSFFHLKAQITAVGGCTSVTITDYPDYPEVLEFVGRIETVVFNVSENLCDRFISGPNPVLKPQIFLDKENPDGTFSSISSIVTDDIIDREFTSLQKGTYRVGSWTPKFREFPCTNSSGSGGSGTTDVRHRFINTNTNEVYGFMGTYYIPGIGPAYSNEVLVDNTETSDIIISTMDDTGAPRSSFTDQEQVILDLSMSPHYNRYRINISQVGSSNFRTDGWEDGTDSEIILNTIWTQDGTNDWRFWNGYEYKVSVYLDNKDCKNGVWKKKEIFFKTCASGVNCRHISTVDDQIVVLPNPASNRIILKELDITEANRTHLNITDISGQIVKSLVLQNNEVDISDLKPGIYFLRVLDRGVQTFSSKLVVK